MDGEDGQKTLLRQSDRLYKGSNLSKQFDSHRLIAKFGKKRSKRVKFGHKLPKNLSGSISNKFLKNRFVNK